MKILIVGDTHIHNYPQFAKPWKPGLNSRVKQIADALQPIPDIIAEHKVKLLAHLGDWNWNSSNPYRLVNLTRQLAKSWESAVAANRGFAVGIPGNHDTDGSETDDHNNKPYLDRTNWTVNVFEGVTFYNLGYNNPLPRPDVIPVKSDLTVFLMHKDIAGGKASSGFIYKTDNAIPMSWFSDVLKRLGKRAVFFNGHYHAPQTVGPVNCIGAPVQHNRGDADDLSRGVVIFDTETKKLERVPLDGPRFFELQWQDISSGKYQDFDWADDDRNYVTVVAGSSQEYRDAADWKKQTKGSIFVAMEKKEGTQKQAAEVKEDIALISEEELLFKYLVEKEGMSKTDAKALVKVSKGIS